MDKKKIVYITGTRADFGRAVYILKSIEKQPNLKLEIIATNMHLEKQFGNTINEIEKDFSVYAKIKSLIKDDTKQAMVKTFGKEIIGISEAILKLKPDLILILGDRGEMLAGAIIGKHYGILVGHIAGGHKSGSIDDKIRDAITVFSDFHFVANKKGKKRVISIGANPVNVFITGAPDLDAIRHKDFIKRKEIEKKYKIDNLKPLILLSFHPIVEKEEKNEKNMKIVCESLMEIKDAQVIATFPNADAGGRKMIEVLKTYSNFQIYKHISYKDYLGLMNIASLIIGNSSAGIIEAPSFKIPSINIGNRQNMRERACNVIDVDCDKKLIISALNKALYDKDFIRKIKRCKNPYGNGRTSEYIIEILKNYFNK